jgi:GDP-L-fucose synthase
MCKAYRKQWGLNYIAAILCNIYGPNDNFSLESHIIPTLIRKNHEAKLNNIPQIELWGDGSPKREFMHSDDAANALIYLMHNYNEKMHINIGSGYDVSLLFIAKMIKDIVEYKGDVLWNKSYPNNISRKLMDSSRIKELGWQSSISLEDGIKDTYNWFINNYKK